jgi:hypothetical protein
MSDIAWAHLKSGSTEMRTWIPLEKGVKEGSFITLKGDTIEDRRWEVTLLGPATQADSYEHLNRRHRDVHGGLT